jgi:hypothetical protein
VIVNEGKLIIGSVRGVGSLEANIADPKSGNVVIAVYNIERETAQTVVLHPHLEQDDHDAPAFYVRRVSLWSVQECVTALCIWSCCWCSVAV